MSGPMILSFEASGFVYGLGAVVAWKLLTYGINMHGLLVDKSQPSKISPERVQLLLATFVVAAQYLREANVSQEGSLPSLSSGWLYYLGGSSLIYSVRKAFERYRLNQIKLR